MAGLLVGLLAGQAAFAGSGSVQRGAYKVRYSAINSTQIPASVAKKNAISRQSGTAVVVVTLQKPQPQAPLHAVAANVRGSAHDLMGNKQALDFKRVHEAGSVYSLASVAIGNQQTLTFDLRVEGVASGAVIPVRFNQTFVTD